MSIPDLHTISVFACIARNYQRAKDKMKWNVGSKGDQSSIVV